MKKILLVDDHAGILRMLSRELELEGYDVITALTGREALQKILDGKPDLVLLDIVMPVMNGLEVLSSLRAFSDLPVIAHSVDVQNKELALNSGADDFVVKPFDMSVFLKKIHRLVGRRPGKSERSRTPDRK